MLNVRIHRAVTYRLLCMIAIPSFVFYVGWNFYYLLNGEIAPSIFYAVTGLPSPTTGCVRALNLLLSGHVGESLKRNPFLGLYLLLLLGSACDLGIRFVKDRIWRIHPTLAYAWLSTLGVAWIWQILFMPR